jgi:superoxide dismutase, Cu-Zn family
MGVRNRPSGVRLPTLMALVVLTALGGLAIMTTTAGAGNGASHGSATLTNLAGDTVGFATFTEDGTGRVHVNAKATGLSEGLHGIHVHNTGSCASNFAGAGSHHNPFVAPNLAPTHGAHAGDLPNLTVNPAGAGRLNTPTGRFTLTQSWSTIFDGNGSALVIHAAQDDLVTDTTGNSGARIACGIIEEG